MGIWCLWGMCCGDGSGRVWDGVRMGFVVWGGKGVRVIGLRCIHGQNTKPGRYGKVCTKICSGWCGAELGLDICDDLLMYVRLLL